MKHFSRRSSGALRLLATFMLSACASTPNTLSNSAPGIDFSQYSTFGFLQNPSTDAQNYQSLETSYLKVAVSQQLDRRGLSYSNSPELLVNFYINTQEKIRSRSVPTTSAYYGYRDPFYDPWGGYGTVGMGYETRIEQYTEGTLNIDVVDAATNKLIWEGAVTGRVTDRNIKNLEQTIDNAVADVMTAFPIAPGSH